MKKTKKIIFDANILDKIVSSNKM